MTILLYISVCLRTRQDTISYSSIYIIQKAEFQGKNRGNRRLETGEQGTGIRGKKSGEKQGTGDRGKQGTGIRGKKSGEKNRGLETGETGKQGTGNRRLESGENRGLELGERNQGKRTGDWRQGKQGTGNRRLESGGKTGDWN